MLFIGIIIGTAVSITIMCLMQINRDNELKKECDYWEREAKKYCAVLGEQKIKIQQLECEMCRLEDTEECKQC